MIIAAGDTLPEIVCLHAVRIRASKLQVYFIKVVGKKHHAADDTLSRCSLHNVFNAPEQKSEVGPHSRCILVFQKRQLGAVVPTICVVSDILIVCQSPVAGLSCLLCEINLVVALCKTSIRWASHYN